MGLDGVELIMETEDVFGIRIEDEEAEVCLHPRDVIELVWSKVNRSDKALCPSQRAFYITRRALVDAFGVDRNAVKPESWVSEFIPFDNQPESWARLYAAMGAKSWPELVRPVWMRWMIAVMVLASAGMIFYWGINGGWPMGGWGAISIGMLVWIAACVLTRPWINRIPVYNETVTELSQLAYSSSRMEWTRDGVAQAFKGIVMEVLGVKEGQYSEDAHFVKDYGV